MEYQPPLSFIDPLTKLSHNFCVKISPGVDLWRLDFDCEIKAQMPVDIDEKFDLKLLVRFN